MSEEELLQDVGGSACWLLGIASADDSGHFVERGEERGLRRCPESLTFVDDAEFSSLELREGRPSSQKVC